MDRRLQSHLRGCDRCHRTVENSAVTSGERVVLAKCESCEQRYYLSAMVDLSPHLVVGDIAAWKFCPVRHLTPQRAMHIQRLTGTCSAQAPNHERRRHTRMKLSIPLKVVPLGPNFLPVCNAREAISLDISDHGISFILGSDREANFWLIDFCSSERSGFQAVMKIVRMKPTEDGRWNAAGPFLTAEDMHIIRDTLP